MDQVSVIQFPEAAVRLSRADPAIPLLRLRDADTCEVFLPETTTPEQVKAIQAGVRYLFGVRSVDILLVQGMPPHRIIGQWG